MIKIIKNIATIKEKSSLFYYAPYGCSQAQKCLIIYRRGIFIGGVVYGIPTY